MAYSKEELQAEMVRREAQKRGLIGNDVGGPIISKPEEPTGQALIDQGKYSELLSARNVEHGLEKTWDRLGANVQAGYTGIMGLGSSIAKIADKIGLAPEGTAQKAQAAYDEANKIYQAGKYPETALTKFGAEMLVPGGAGVKLGTKLGGALLGGVGEYIGSAAGGSAIGAALGGLTNTPGQDPNDIFNEQNAKTGALLGAPLGAAGQFISNFGRNVANYQRGAEELAATGYKGPVLARDYADDAVSQIKSNWMDNIIATGIRDEQLSAITPAVKNLLGKVTEASEKQGSHRLGQIIRGVNNRLENESSEKWNDLFQSAKDAGISKINTDLTKKSVSDFLDNYADSLSKNDRNLLTTLAQAKQVDFGTLNKVKGSDIWRMAEKFGAREDTKSEDMANSLRDIYWNITDDIGNSLQSKPELVQSWNAAREFTKGVKDIFNVQNNRKLVNAINDVNENTGQLKTFINSVVNPVSSKAANYYNKALGDTYKNTVSDLAFNKVFNSSFNSEANGLNLNKFFADIRESDAAGILNNDTVKALSVLEKHFNTIQMAQKGAENSMASSVKSAVPIAQGAAIGAGYMAGGLPGGAGAAAAVMLAPKVLGMISKASPLKNRLIWASKIYGKNPGITEYLMDSIGKKMSQAGVTMSVSPEGVRLDKTENK